MPVFFFLSFLLPSILRLPWMFSYIFPPFIDGSCLAGVVQLKRETQGWDLLGRNTRGFINAVYFLLPNS